jgi:hypothetical protein
MRKLIIGAILALALPATAAAAPKEPTPEDRARTACKTEKHAMGTQLFKRTYGAKSTSKAMKACIAKAEPAAEEETKNAAQACKAERDADEDAFADKYGTNKNGKNAFGKCVSGMASAKMQEEANDRANAAHTCKALRREKPAEFTGTYGTGKNAFGKCVSATARAND